MTLTSLPLRSAVSRLLRQPWSAESAGVSLFMLLALLLVLRGDLLIAGNSSPAGKPNYFLYQYCFRTGRAAEKPFWRNIR